MRFLRTPQCILYTTDSTLHTTAYEDEIKGSPSFQKHTQFQIQHSIVAHKTTKQHGLSYYCADSVEGTEEYYVP